MPTKTAAAIEAIAQRIAAVPRRRLRNAARTPDGGRAFIVRSDGWHTAATARSPPVRRPASRESLAPGARCSRPACVDRVYSEPLQRSFRGTCSCSPAGRLPRAPGPRSGPTHPLHSRPMRATVRGRRRALISRRPCRCGGAKASTTRRVRHGRRRSRGQSRARPGGRAGRASRAARR
jgi:hypothetical protein